MSKLNEKITSGHLTEFREEMDITRDELAKALKTTYTTVYRWETGERAIPPVIELALDAIRFGLSPHDFIGRCVDAVVKAAKKHGVKMTDEQTQEIENTAFNDIHRNLYKRK